MVRRFQIEDLIAQDAGGVVFRAVDLEAGRVVALRRFFPHGADGGGLSQHQQNDYQQALAKLEGVVHPALREFICGGSDPIDGMPFIATGWVEGETLDAILWREPLTVGHVIGIVTHALLASEVLSNALGDEAVWVDTAANSIVHFDDGGASRFLFWIAPLKHLDKDDGSKGLMGLASLAESIGAWNEWNHDDPAVRALGGWIQWLRLNAASTNLAGARLALDSFLAMEPPEFVGIPASRIAKKPSSRGALIWVGIALFLLCAGLVGWWMKHRHHNERVAKGEVKPAMEAPAAAIPPPAMQEARPPVISWKDHAALVGNSGKQVTVEGSLRSVSIYGRTNCIYLYFSNPSGKNDVRGLIKYSGAPPENIRAELQKLVGKTVRITGKVAVAKAGGLERPDILLPDREAVRPVP